MSTDLSQQIGANLRKARLRKGLTQAAVALKASTNTNYYAKLERGETVPSLKMLQKVVASLGARSADILPY
jgi:transcriptional regulator with XRE-family HTH domain